MTTIDVSFRDRVLAMGTTRSGKSTLLRYLFSLVRVRRAVVDPKGEWRFPGVQRVDVPIDEAAARGLFERVDWSAPLLHFRTPWLPSRLRDRVSIELLYERLAGLPGDLLVLTDEGYAVSNANWAPSGLNALQVAGGGMGHGHWYASQRPRHIATSLKTEASVLLIFPPVDVDDLREVLRGVGFVTLDEALKLLNGLPHHGYLIVDRKQWTVAIGPPLPGHLLAAS